MTVLTACQQASRLMGLTAPTSVFGSTDAYPIELSGLVNEAAAAIAKAHDWRKLTVLKTQAGDGATTAFSLPTDYDRMPLKGNVYSTRSRLPLGRVADADAWLDMDINSTWPGTGAWIILGGWIQIKPVLSASESAKYYYISNLFAAAADTTPKAQFDNDGDTFRLPERLLTLSIIWRWRHLKGLEYAEQMRNFEIAFGEEAGRDKGSRILHVGTARVPDGAELAYPVSINA